MSITALIFIVIYGIGLILTFYNPYFGVLTYLFEWHNHPPYMWWGDELPAMRWSFVIAIATMVSWFINRKRLPKLKDPDVKPVFWLVFITINAYVVSYYFAVIPEESFRKAEIWLKLTINYFLLIQLVRRYKDYRMMIWVILIGVANFGRISFERGSNRHLGFVAPNATEENAIAAHVVAMLPFFGFYFFNGKRWEKIISFLSVPFALNLIILANSRAAFVALAAIGIMSVFIVKGKVRIYVILSLVLGVLLFLRLSNEQFWERQETVETYEKESSAMSRIYLWKGGIKLMKDHPFGVGGEGYEYYSFKYVPELIEKLEQKGGKTVHNTFLNVGTEWGIIALLLYMGFIIHSFLIIFQIKRYAKRFSMTKYYIEATAVQLALTSILIAGFFHNRQYAEVVFWLSAFGVILRNIQRTEIASLNEPAPENKYSLPQFSDKI